MDKPPHTPTSHTYPSEPMHDQPKPLEKYAILSLALNIPGPVALQRLRSLGAQCSKLETPSGDPLQIYSPTAYALLHEGIRTVQADLKSAAGQTELTQLLKQSQVLLLSFRPQALVKLGLDPISLAQNYPHLHVISIVGEQGEAANVPGHDLTYVASQGLITGQSMPPTLFADMSGALMAVEAVLAALLNPAPSFHQIALADGAAYLAQPRQWGLMADNETLGGGLPTYRIYPCLDGRVALAALEPHFADNLRRALSANGYQAKADFSELSPFFATKNRLEINEIATQFELPLHTMH